MDTWALPEFTLERCTGCGLCETYCPTGVLHLVDHLPVMVTPAECSYCGTCEDICPAGAVELSYEIYISKKG